MGKKWGQQLWEKVEVCECKQIVDIHQLQPSGVSNLGPTQTTSGILVGDRNLSILH